MLVRRKNIETILAAAQAFIFNVGDLHLHWQKCLKCFLVKPYYFAIIKESELLRQQLWQHQ